MIDGNGTELIKKFMGVPDGVPMAATNYSGDWNCLMPVVEKIEILMWEVEIRANRCAIVKYPDSSKCFYGATGSKIGSTYHAITEFIKWYNENKQP